MTNISENLKELDAEDMKVLQNIELAVKLLKEAQLLMSNRAVNLYAEADLESQSSNIGFGCPNHLGNIRYDVSKDLKIMIHDLLNLTYSCSTRLSIRPK